MQHKVELSGVNTSKLKVLKNEETQALLRRAKALVPILVPLFISAFRRADELATAMECRCYHGGEGRTKLYVLRYQRRDFFCILLTTLITAAVVLLSRLGL